MAVYRDIDSDVRIGGSLSIPSGSITLNGVNLETTIGSKVDKTFILTAGGGLTGGGAFSQNRELAVDFSGTGSATTVSRSDHNHDTTYLKLTGGTLSNTLTINKQGDGASVLSLGTERPWNFKQTGTGNNAELSLQPTTDGRAFSIVDTSGNKVLRVVASTTTPSVLIGANQVWHAGNFTPSNKVDTSTLTAHTGNANIHKHWGNWSTNEANDLRVNGYKALTHVTSSNMLHINYSSEFTGGVEIKGALTNNGNQVWHAGNLNLSGFLTTDNPVNLKANSAVHGRLYLGTSGGTDKAGSIVLRDNNERNRILINTTATDVTNWVINLDGVNGSATFASNVHANSISVTSTAMVTNLNAEYIGGSKETDFVRSSTVRDIQGYGVLNGLIVVQKTPTPDMTVQVLPGIYYTNSGRRFQITNNTTVTMGQSSLFYDRIDIICILGKESGANEGNIEVITGDASGSNPQPKTASIPVGAFVIAHIYVRANIGTITDGTGGTFNAITNSVKRMMNLRLSEGTAYYIDEPTYIKHDIYEKNVKLENKYSQLGTSSVNVNNTMYGNQKINGRIHINATGSLSDVATGSDYGLRVGNDTSYIAMDANEILSTNDMYVRAKSGALFFGASSGGITFESKIKADKNAVTLTIPAGSTSVTWTHNYGLTTYAITATANSFERHVRWRNKSANTVVIEIDDPSSEVILVDCILIGY